MESNTANKLHDVSTKNDTSKSVTPETVEQSKVEDIVSINSGGDVNMEASVSEDDVMKAGGFGARDDISSFLPVASDSTDFEASLRDAREYEEPQKDVCRPGLGWKEDGKEQE